MKTLKFIGVALLIAAMGLRCRSTSELASCGPISISSTGEIPALAAFCNLGIGNLFGAAVDAT